MKKLLICLLSLSLLLCGCGPKEPEYDADLLEYPGLRWGMTLEEVQSALGFSDADILDSAIGTFNPERPTSPAYHNYSVGNLEIFGFPTAQVILRFYEYAGHEPGLGEMVVYFPDGYEGSDATDMDALRRTLTEHYGEKAEVVTMVSWDDWSGEVQKDEYPYPGDDPCYWVAKTTVRDLLTEEELEKLHGISNASRAEAGLDRNLPSLEEFCQTQENAAVTLNLRTYEEGDYLDWLREQGATSQVLTVDAQLVVHLQTIDRYFE